MSPLSKENLLAALHWRYATKHFDRTKKIPAEIWGALEEVLVLSPSSFGMQPWKFCVVKDPEVRKKLTPATRNQAQIEEASHMVVFAAKQNLGQHDIDAHIERVAEVRSMPHQSLAGYHHAITATLMPQPKDALNIWATKQCYIALGSFLTAAAVLGVDACPMEGFDAGEYNHILGLNDDGYSAVVVATAGYRAEHDSLAKAKKVRFPKEKIIITR